MPGGGIVRFTTDLGNPNWYLDNGSSDWANYEHGTWARKTGPAAAPSYLTIADAPTAASARTAWNLAQPRNLAFASVKVPPGSHVQTVTIDIHFESYFMGAGQPLAKVVWENYVVYDPQKYASTLSTLTAVPGADAEDCDVEALAAATNGGPKYVPMVASKGAPVVRKGAAAVLLPPQKTLLAGKKYPGKTP